MYTLLDSNVLNEFSKDSFNILSLSTKKLLKSKGVSSLAVICLPVGMVTETVDISLFLDRWSFLCSQKRNGGWFAFWSAFLPLVACLAGASRASPLFPPPSTPSYHVALRPVAT
jgi:hypothetical protein